LKGIVYLLLVIIITSCFLNKKKKPSSEVIPVSCSKANIRNSIVTILESITTETDFSFYVEDINGENITYNRGGSTLSTSYESASTSKWVSAAIIMKQVENGFLNLLDKPQDHLTSWSINSGEELYNMTLTDLLSFNSGLVDEPVCLNLGIANFENCVNNISNSNTGNGKIPGQEFYYSSTHMQVAGMMAVKARGDIASWQELFSEFQTETGLFANSNYDLPSVSNPRLAGGMHWTGNDYIKFLRFFRDNTILSSSSKALMLTDRVLSVGYSPAFEAIGEDWHYGFGLWLQCPNAIFNCSSIEYISSPGAYGAYPFINLQHNFFGIVARQGALGTFRNGFAVYQAVQEQVEQWVKCK